MHSKTIAVPIHIIDCHSTPVVLALGECQQGLELSRETSVVPLAFFGF